MSNAVRPAGWRTSEFAPGFPVSRGIYPPEYPIPQSRTHEPNTQQSWPSMDRSEWFLRRRAEAHPVSSVESDVIRILVGREKVLFVVHEAVLRYYSEFFDTALKGEFKEAKEHTFELDEEDPEIFKLFVHFIYFGRIYENDAGIWGTGRDQEEYEDNYSRLCRLWIFGDRRGISQLQDYVISCLYRFKGFESMSRYCQAVNLAYDETPKGCKLQRLVVYHTAMTTVEYGEQFHMPSGIWPQDFLADIIREFATSATGRSISAMEQSMKAEFRMA